MAYQLLSEPIRRYIRDKKWSELRPIQAAAITRILGSEDNFILASRTASGKTEAAFLPVLSKVNFSEHGIQVLYISPLIALINDQFQRVEDLCKYMDVTVTKWHGEANKSAKDRLLKAPQGVLLITPESIEAMLINHPENARVLFSNLKFIIIDEIHVFLGNDRGLHLRSLLSRINRLSKKEEPRMIGLSATIGDYEEAKRFVGKEGKTKVLLDRTTKEIEAAFNHYETKGNEFPVSFIEELYEHVKDKKVLIFPNSRGKAEELAVKLKKTADRKKGHVFYFSHHSSVDKELREYIEEFAKNNKRNNFCIACTSTLELGIDIGTVDLVIQIDSAHSIASLIQRVGRSGRREGLTSNLLLYTTDKWHLLQSFSCWELFQTGFVEPVYGQSKPFDLLFHQVLSIVKENCGIPGIDLVQRITGNAAFASIESIEVDRLLQYMIENDFLEDLKRELIVGYEGEKLTNSREFYSVFSTPAVFKVIHSGKGIGEIPLTTSVVVNQNIYLAAKIWQITDVDLKSLKILVVPANDGKKPLFLGEGGDVHPSIREKMLELLYSTQSPENANEAARDSLTELRKQFRHISIEELKYDRPYIVKEDGIVLYTFTGTRINRTIQFLLKEAGIEAVWEELDSSFRIKRLVFTVEEILSKIKQELSTIENSIHDQMVVAPDSFQVSKWAVYLPLDLKKKYVLANNFDIFGTMTLLNNIRWLKGENVAHDSSKSKNNAL